MRFNFVTKFYVQYRSEEISTYTINSALPPFWLSRTYMRQREPIDFESGLSLAPTPAGLLYAPLQIDQLVNLCNIKGSHCPWDSSPTSSLCYDTSCQFANTNRKKNLKMEPKSKHKSKKCTRNAHIH